MSEQEIRRLVESCEAVVRETAHHMSCGCVCGATDRFKAARSEFYRQWRAWQKQPLCIESGELPDGTPYYRYR